MAKDIRRYELVEDTSDEEAVTMKAQMRIEEAQRMRRARVRDRHVGQLQPHASTARPGGQPAPRAALPARSGAGCRLT